MGWQVWGAVTAHSDGCWGAGGVGCWHIGLRPVGPHTTVTAHLQDSLIQTKPNHKNIRHSLQGDYQPWRSVCVGAPPPESSRWVGLG